MQGSAIAGATVTVTETPESRPRRTGVSLAARLVALVSVVVVVPLVLYLHFQAADREKQALLLRSVQDQGRIASAALRPVLERFEGSALPAVSEIVGRVAGPHQRIRLLFRPTGISGIEGFYYVAAEPPLENQRLEQERGELFQAGVLQELAESCDGDRQLAVRYLNPTGQAEVLTSVTPFRARSGCWVIITSTPSGAILGSLLGRPYWEAAELQIAAAVYALLVVVVLSVFFELWGSLYRFARLARDIRGDAAGGRSFAALNRIPELNGVAEEFDRMVDGLRKSSEAIRFAAEENAHAFKTPIAVIAQAVEPLRRVTAADPRGSRAVEVIEKSVARLDALVSASRRIDRALAAMVNPPRDRLNAATLVEQIVEDYRPAADAHQVRFETVIARDVPIRASEELLEAALGNILENAISFSPSGGRVRVTLARNKKEAEIAVADEGPGLDPAHVDKIFDRYFSSRPSNGDDSAGASRAGMPGGANFGIGLWIVRRNVEALGGHVTAENRQEGGLCIRITLPTK